MKRILAFFLAAILAASNLCASAYSDIPDGAPYGQAVLNLTAYGVLSGKTGDAFDPDGVLTRAEFSKISVIVAGLKQKRTGLLFSDVPAAHWANGYIGAAAENGLLIAYPDGNFRPDTAITYAQAATVVLRLLGYSDDVLAGIWPANFLDKAAELGITQGLSFDPGAPVTRRDCAVMLDRALMTKKYKNAAYGGDKLLIENMGFSVSDECVVYASKAEAPALLENEVQTTGGTYLTLTDPEAFMSRKGKLVLDGDDQIVHFLPSAQTSVSTKSSKTLSVFTIAGDNAFTLYDDSIIFYNGSRLSYEELCDDHDSLWSNKDTVVYLTQNGGVDYIFVGK